MQFILSNFTATAVIITISAMILLSHKDHRDKEKGRNDVLPSTSSSPSNGLYITAIVLSMSLLASFYRYPVTQARPNLLPNVLPGSYASSHYQNSLAVFVATAKKDYGQGALSQVLDSHFKRDDERKNTRTSTSVLPADDNAGAKRNTIPSTPNTKIHMGSTSESATEVHRISISTTGSTFTSTSVLPANDNAGAKGSTIPSTPNTKIHDMGSTSESAAGADRISISTTGSMVSTNHESSFPFLDI